MSLEIDLSLYVQQKDCVTLHINVLLHFAYIHVMPLVLSNCANAGFDSSVGKLLLFVLVCSIRV